MARLVASSLPLVALLAVACAGPRRAPGPGPAAPDLASKVGVQLYSVRALMEKDMPGTLRRVRDIGFARVEVHKLLGHPAAQFRAALDAAGLAAPSMMAAFDRLATDVPGVIADARALGARFVACPWIPHEGGFDEEDARRAIEVFSTAGRALRDAGLRLVYHVHGYELHPRGLGATLLDRMITATEPGVVDFEMDVFYMVYGGADPVAYLERYPGRFPLLHLKDMRAGTPPGTTGKVDQTSTVPLGDGVIDFRPVIAAAERQGAVYYFVEDESPTAPETLSRSVAWLRALDAR